MEQALQITYHGATPSEALDDLIRRETAHLERFFPRIISARVVVEHAFRTPQTLSPFDVRIELGVPGDVVTIHSEPHKDAATAVHDAFRRAKRRLQDYSRILRGNVKQHRDKAPSVRAEGTSVERTETE